MKQKTRFKNFRNISYRLSVHEWPKYWYWSPKSHIVRSLLQTPSLIFTKLNRNGN